MVIITMDLDLVLLPEPLSVPSISSLHITHPDMSNNYGFIGVIVSGGTSPFTYSLNGGNPQSTPNFYSLSEGEYSILVKDSNDLEDSISGIKLKSERVADLYIAAIEMSKPTVYGDDGSIAIYALAGVPPYEYRLGFDGDWQSSNTFTNLEEGDYDILVQDSTETVRFVSGIKLVAADAGIPSISGITLAPPSYGGSDGSIEVSAEYGYPPYEYRLDEGDYQDSNIFTGLGEGIYTVYVGDQRGNEGHIEGIVLSSRGIDYPRITVTSIVHPTSRNDNGEISLSVSGGLVPYMFSINDSAFTASSEFKNLSEGVYKLTVKDANLTESTLEGISLKKTLVYNQTLEATVSDGSIGVNVRADQQIKVNVNVEELHIS